MMCSVFCTFSRFSMQIYPFAALLRRIYHVPSKQKRADLKIQIANKVFWTYNNGIKYSIAHGCRGDVVFDAKTDALARHYELDFHAKRIPSTEFGGPKRYMLADEDAWRLFSKYLTEDEP